MKALRRISSEESSFSFSHCMTKGSNQLKIFSSLSVSLERIKTLQNLHRILWDDSLQCRHILAVGIVEPLNLKVKVHVHWTCAEAVLFVLLQCVLDVHTKVRPHCLNAQVANVQLRGKSTTTKKLVD